MKDEELLELVREAFDAYEPPPGRVLDDARAAYRWWQPGAVLAGVSSDTHTRDLALRGSGSRLLTFGGAGVDVEIEVTETGRTREIAGQLSPVGEAEVRVRHGAGELLAQADPVGQFVVLDVPAGLASLSFRLADGTSIVTSWVWL